MFETETMAELCLKQGLIDQAIDIFRRLAEAAEDPETRRRCEARLSALAREPSVVPLETPGLRVSERADSVEIEWRLPPETRAPALQLLLLRQTPEGIAADPRTLPVTAADGRLIVPVSNLRGVRAAAGRLEGDAFIPLARFPDRPGVI